MIDGIPAGRPWELFRLTEVARVFKFYTLYVVQLNFMLSQIFF